MVHRRISLGEIFLRYVTVDLVEDILEDMHPETFLMDGGARIMPKSDLVYKMMATQIRILGEQQTPKENVRNVRPLHPATQVSLGYFMNKYPLSKYYGIGIIETMMARFIIGKNFAITFFQSLEILDSTFRAMKKYWNWLEMLEMYELYCPNLIE